MRAFTDDAIPRGRHTSPPFVYIGTVAQQVGASAKAIRMYEAMGLLGVVQRQGVYRVYSPQQVARVRLIRQAQGLGIRLADVAPALKARTGEPDWAALAEQVARHRAALAAEVSRLQQLDGALRHIHQELLGCGSVPWDQSVPAACTA